MHNPADIHVGLKFGRFEVVSRLNNGAGEQLRGKIWECKCECGNIAIKGTQDIRRAVRRQERNDGYVTGCRQCRMRGGWSNPAKRIRPYEGLYNGFTLRARKEGKIVKLTYAQFLPFTEITLCHYCEVDIEWGKPFNARGLKWNLDRKDNSRGYEIDGEYSNIVVACTDCNYAKGHRYSYEIWYAMAAPLRAINRAKRNRIERGSLGREVETTASLMQLLATGKGEYSPVLQ